MNTEARLAKRHVDAIPSIPSVYPVGVPIAASREGPGLTLKLASIGADEFIDPFFVDTLTRIADVPLLDLHLTEHALLAAEAAELRQPAGIIFQVSRCGSTLLANMLRSAAHCIVYSEPLALNDVLMPPHDGWSEDAVCQAIRCVGRYLGAAVGDSPYVIKVRSWNTLHAALIRRAFPDTPWLFLTRDPLEVAVSVMRRPPTWLRAYGNPGNPFLPYLPEAAAKSGPEAYVAHVLGAFAAAIGPLGRDAGRMIDYGALGVDTCFSIAADFGLTMKDEGDVGARSQLGLYSKDASRTSPFSSDGAAKQAEASSLLRTAIDTIARPQFGALGIEWSYS